MQDQVDIARQIDVEVWHREEIAREPSLRRRMSMLSASVRMEVEDWSYTPARNYCEINSENFSFV